MKGYFITGVGTDVGKTYISSLFYKELKKYIKTDYYKPIQSGCFYEANKLVAPDLKFLSNFSETPYDTKMCSYMLIPEVSPHLASEIENKNIDIQLIYDEIEKKEKETSILLVEGAGGVYVPIIRDEVYMFDFMKMTNYPVILVANTKVGGINHAMLSIEFLRSKNIKIYGIVFNGYTGKDFEDDNIKVVLKDSGITNYLVIKENQIEIEKNQLFNFFKLEECLC